MIRTTLVLAAITISFSAFQPLAYGCDAHKKVTGKDEASLLLPSASAKKKAGARGAKKTSATPTVASGNTVPAVPK